MQPLDSMGFLVSLHYRLFISHHLFVKSNRSAGFHYREIQLFASNHAELDSIDPLISLCNRPFYYLRSPRQV
jgi:hypothetical protein